ncbi:MAG: MFS transporter [Hyphomicrobium sp.]
MEKEQRTRALAAGAIGNLLEWYDFAVYGYFANQIGRIFFPKEEPVAQILAAFGIFAVGYFMRPLGGAFLGYIGDKFGRRAALNISIVAMALPTFLIGILPGYSEIGIIAPLLLTLLRMIQGLSVGGEYTTSMVFMIEHAHQGRRGLAGGLACAGCVAGILFGSGTAAILAALMSPETLAVWGWRLPFLFGLIIGLTGFIIRRHIPETDVKKGDQSPIVEVLRKHLGLILHLSAFAAFNAVGFYIVFVYLVSWLQFVDGVTPAKALELNSFTMIILFVTVIAIGALSDKVGRKPILFLSTGIGFLTAYPFFWLLHHTNTFFALVGEIGLAITVGCFIGVQPVTMVESVPKYIRCIALALGYNLTIGIIGGCTPMVATWLVHRTQNDLSPSFLIMIAAALSFGATYYLKLESVDEKG